MAFNVDNLKGALKFGGTRSSLFEVYLSVPQYLTQVSELGRFLVRASEIPAASVGVVDVTYFGRATRFAGNRTFADWTVTVLNDEDFEIRDALEAWSNSINSFSGNRRAPGVPDNGAGSYKTSAIVNQLGKDGSLLRQYEFQGIFPTEVAAIGLDWGTEGIQEFTTTFTYDQWVVIPQNSAAQTTLGAQQF